MRIISAFVLSASLFAPAAFAQTSMPAGPSCDGAMAIIRVSDIKPDSMDKFLSAVSAQKAWYASHNVSDKIFVTRLVDRGASNYSTTQAITYHFYASGAGSEPTHDAGFDAFVKLFADSSTIKATYLTCVPKGMAPPM